MPRSRKRNHKSRRQRDPSSSSSSTSTSSSSSSSSDRSRRRPRRKSKKSRRSTGTVSQNVILASVIPEFDPLVDNVNMWINVVEANAHAFGWSDQMMIYQALQKLRNTAKTWYDSLQKNHTSWTAWKWQEWRATLLETFQIKRNMHSMLKTLIEMKPYDGQSLYEFYFQQKNQIDRLGLQFSEQDIISIVVGSIGDTNIITAAEAGNFRHSDDLASLLHGRIHTAIESNKTNKNNPLLLGKQHASRTFSTNSAYKPRPVSTSLRPQINCYRCGEAGHRRVDCSMNDTVRCNKCNILGHMEAACRSGQRSKTEKDADVKRVVVQEVKQKFYKDVTLNGRKCKAFIDMGSDCSLITSNLVKELGLKPSKLNKPVHLVGFTGSMTVEVTEAVVVNFGVDQVELIVTFYVINSLAGCEILVGRNFTEERSIMYTRVGDKLTFSSVEFVANVQQVSFNSESMEHATILNNIFAKYPQCVASDLSNLGKTDGVELEIEVTSNRPVYHRPYRMSESEKTVTRKMVEDLLDNGIIRDSNSSYASPALLVDKASGEKRLCVDYRALNKITVKEKYPMPVVDDLIDRLRGCKCYTSLDLKCGYYQIPIKADSIHKTAFITSDGHYEFQRMPFGVCNGPAVFQRLMNTVLGNLRFGRVICYMDDLLIATDGLEENIACLENVLQLFEKYGLTINLKKCFFFQDHITFLGYDISEEGIRPHSKKLKAIENYPTPKTVHQLRQFLGLINYFRKFIKNCAFISSPLTSLLKKDAGWQWGPPQDEAVIKLKQALIENAVLQVFDPKLPVILYTDASRDGLGCILVQVTENGEKPVHFYSRQTTKDEKQYHSFELELLAIIVGLQKFRHYLLGSVFKIVTDCSAVRYTLSKQDIVPRIGRWVLQTQEFTFDIVHRAGSQMQHVDALSRNPVTNQENEKVSQNRVMAITEGDWLLSVQLQDPEICGIREILESGDAERNKQIYNDYELLGNKVYRRTEYGRRWMVPKQCIWQIIRANHDEVGHFAVDKTVERIKSNYWFPRLKKTVTKYVNNCINCIYYKNTHGKKPGKLFPIPKYARPFHTLHLDHLGPFVKTTKQNCYLLVIVDSFTKFVFISPVRNTKSKVVINELDKIFKVFGNANRVVCDAGSAFTSKLFTDYCKEKNIRAHIIATAVPRSNGQVERYNQTILEALRAMGADSDNNKWDQHIQNIQQGINSTINKTTSAIPSEVFFGYRLRMDCDKNVESDQQAVDVTTLRKDVDAQIKINAERQKLAFDSKRKDAPAYGVGDLVVLRIPSQSNDGQSTKLLPLFKGPFQITEVLGHDRYKVADMRGSERSSRRYDGIACVENMKPWIRINNNDL